MIHSYFLKFSGYLVEVSFISSDFSVLINVMDWDLIYDIAPPFYNISGDNSVNCFNFIPVIGSVFHDTVTI